MHVERAPRQVADRVRRDLGRVRTSSRLVTGGSFPRSFIARFLRAARPVATQCSHSVPLCNVSAGSPELTMAIARLEGHPQVRRGGH